MKFNNIRVFNLKEGFLLPDVESLESQLYDYAYTEIRPEQAATFGFVSPFGRRSSTLVHQVGHNALIAARKEQKIVPEAAVKAALEKKELAYYEEHNTSMPKKLKKELREEIYEQMLRTAFTRHSDTFAYFDRKNNRLVVGATSASQAEDFTALIRGALGSFPSRPWLHDVKAVEHLSEWLRTGEAPEGFEFGDGAKFDGTGEGSGSITLRKKDLQSDQVISLLESGDECTRIGLNLIGHLSFSVDTELAIKGIKFDDIVINNSIDSVTENYAEEIDSNFVLWASELNLLIETLNAVFTGEATEDAA